MKTKLFFFFLMLVVFIVIAFFASVGMMVYGYGIPVHSWWVLIGLTAFQSTLAFITQYVTPKLLDSYTKHLEDRDIERIEQESIRRMKRRQQERGPVIEIN